jgi:hypothetical protein
MLIKSKDIMNKFQEYLNIQRERNLLMKDVSKLLGVDFTFSEKEMIASAEESLTKFIEKEVKSEMNKWMK